MTNFQLFTAAAAGAVPAGVLLALLVVKVDGARRRHAARRRALRQRIVPYSAGNLLDAEFSDYQPGPIVPDEGRYPRSAP